MSALTLVIGSKTFSSWSLRPWLLLKHHQVPFEEKVIALNAPDTAERIRTYSPSGKVPVLLHGERCVWESLAICEYAAETFLLPAAWPMDPAARSFARSAAAEMHAGFPDLRRELPFEANRDPEHKSCSAKTTADIQRVRDLWREARTQFGRGGQWLCGRFGIIDAMFAPVALRFFVYDIPLDGPEAEYVDTVVLHPAIQAWMEAATLEQPLREPAQARTQELAEAVLPARTDVAVSTTAVAPPAPKHGPKAKAERASHKPSATSVEPTAATVDHPRLRSRVLPSD